MDKRNDAIVALARVCIELDKLQVELCDKTPYEIPDAQETRRRIRSTFDDLEKVTHFLENLKYDE